MSTTTVQDQSNGWPFGHAAQKRHESDSGVQWVAQAPVEPRSHTDSGRRARHVMSERTKSRRSTPRTTEKSISDSKKETPALSEDRIDESLKETFPASDPPSWTVASRIGSPR
jgi:hypothetical protein